jgi:hypothetical protein
MRLKSAKMPISRNFAGKTTGNRVQNQHPSIKSPKSTTRFLKANSKPKTTKGNLISQEYATVTDILGQESTDNIISGPTSPIESKAIILN